MDELKKLIEAMAVKFAESQEGRIKAEKALEVQVKALDTKYAALEGSQDPTEIKKLMASIAELENEVSDVRTKAATHTVELSKSDKQKLHDEVLKPVIGKWLKGKKNSTPTEFFKFVEDGG